MVRNLEDIAGSRSTHAHELDFWGATAGDVSPKFGLDDHAQSPSEINIKI